MALRGVGDTLSRSRQFRRRMLFGGAGGGFYKVCGMLGDRHPEDVMALILRQ
jgi:hypothetical protein